MGTVANSNIGFKGTVSSAETPQMFGRPALYSVEGKADLKVTAGGAGDRAVTVAAGSAWGDGVLSKWTTGAVLTCAANSTGATRYDTVVIRRTWTPAGTPTGTATLMVLTGGSAAAVAAGRLTDRGVTSSDQPIALVPVPNGSAVVGTPIDLRCWSGEGGGLVAEHVAALQYLGSKGTQVRIGTVTYTRLEDASGTLYWDTPAVPGSTRAVASLVRSDGSALVNASLSAGTDLKLTGPTVTGDGWNTSWSGSGLGNSRPGLYWLQATLLTDGPRNRFEALDYVAAGTDPSMVILATRFAENSAGANFGSMSWGGFIYCPNGLGLRFNARSDTGSSIRQGTLVAILMSAL